MHMISIIAISITIWSCFYVDGVSAQEDWIMFFSAYTVKNLTGLILRDAMLKYRQADRIQEKYRNTLQYQLGLLTAGIMELFKHMLQIYSEYCHHELPYTSRVDRMLMALEYIHGDYLQILIERELFFTILADFEKRGDLTIENPKEPPTRRPEQITDSQSEEHIEEGQGESGDEALRSPQKKQRPFYIRADKQRKEEHREILRNQKFSSKTPNALRTGHKRNVFPIINRDEKEEEHKRRIRYKAFASKWRGFDPEVEGVHVDWKVAKAGLKNESSFLLRDIQLQDV